MSFSERFLTLLFNDPLKKSDVIILLCGDMDNRVKKVVQLFKDGWGGKILISGGIEDLNYGSIPSFKLKKKIIKLGVSDDSIILENESLNTKDQAKNVISLVTRNKWKRLILVASHYHQARAFLTFLKQLEKNNLRVEIINAAASDLDWFKKNDWGVRFSLLEQEFDKIKAYQKRGDVSSFKKGLEYLKWRQQL